MPWRRATRATTRPACSSRGYGPAKVAAAAWAAAAASEALLVGAVVPATRASSLRVGCCSRLGARSKVSYDFLHPTAFYMRFTTDGMLHTLPTTHYLLLLNVPYQASSPCTARTYHVLTMY